MDGKGPVPAHRHQNPDGTTGGWVADTAEVASTATIGPQALVYGQAKVLDVAVVTGKAKVLDAATILGKAKSVWGGLR